MSIAGKTALAFIATKLVWLAMLNDNATASQLVADSVAEFSGTQALHGWTYGYYDGDSASPYTPADFEQFPLFDGTKWLIEETGPPIPRGYWTRISATGGHPNGNLTTSANSANHWAVRRWTSASAGLYTIMGALSDDSPALNPPPPREAYNGVVGHIFVDGAEMLSLPIDEGGNTNYSLALSLNVGSIVDFAIDPKRSSINPDRTVDWTDTTTFTAQIHVVPEPSTLSIAAFMCLCPAFCCYSQRLRYRMSQRVSE